MAGPHSGSTELAQSRQVRAEEAQEPGLGDAQTAALALLRLGRARTQLKAFVVDGQQWAHDRESLPRRHLA